MRNSAAALQRNEMEQKIAPDWFMMVRMHIIAQLKDKCCCFNKSGHRASQAEAGAAEFQRKQLLSVLMEPMYNSWTHTELRG